MLHPSPLWGALMPPLLALPPSSLMPDRSGAVWNEMRGWPRYEREADDGEDLCPAGMEVITDNIISSCWRPDF